MKYIKMLIIASFMIVLTACSVNIEPDQKTLESVDLTPTLNYDSSKVSKKIIDIAKKNFDSTKTLLTGENTPFEIKISEDATISQSDNDKVAAYGIKFENKDENLPYSFSVIPVPNDFNPKSFYVFYSENFKVDIVDIKNMDLVMNSIDNNELVAQFKARDEKYYVVTLKSNFNTHEKIYIMNKINENIKR